jgi:hypothetical protein
LVFIDGYFSDIAHKKNKKKTTPLSWIRHSLASSGWRSVCFIVVSKLRYGVEDQFKIIWIIMIAIIDLIGSVEQSNQDMSVCLLVRYIRRKMVYDEAVASEYGQ